MVVIYTQDCTYIRKKSKECKKVLIDIYGEKFGNEAYDFVCKGSIGQTFRKNGGPLIRLVSKEEAKEIYGLEEKNGILVV